MTVSLAIRARVMRGRLVLRFGDGPWRVWGTVARCPCCGEEVLSCRR
jgi:hypothetical protein